jgi:hypothetical protein
VCAAGCPSGATRQDGFTDLQINAAVEAMLEGSKELVRLILGEPGGNGESESKNRKTEEETVSSSK